MSASPDTIRRRLLSVDDYRLMAEAGVFAPDERVELIEGEIVAMPPIGSTHAGLVSRLDKRLGRTVEERALIWVQNPIVLPEHSAPQPDLALLKPRDDDYMRSLPVAADALLVIEVADSSLAWDRDRKLPLFAAFGVPEAWLIDCEGERLTVYRDPSADGYRSIAVADLSVPLSVSTLSGVTVDLSGLFG